MQVCVRGGCCSLDTVYLVYFIFFKTQPLTGLSLTNLVGLAGQQATWIHPSLPPYGWGYKHAAQGLDILHRFWGWVPHLMPAPQALLLLKKYSSQPS